MAALFRCRVLVLGLAVVATPVAASWTAGNADVVAAISEPRIAAALRAVDAIDRAAVSDDHAAFAALLADDLAVNNPQNGVSVRGATAQRSAAGQISYAQYDRVIEYAGLRDGMVLLMGEEVVRPKAPGGGSAAPVHRRFTDLWKQVGKGWRLTARQATVIVRP